MRYFLEVSYNGTNYSGFQTQKNANTIHAEIEKALKILLKKEIELTGSSRTDAGVHAYQNYFHFDIGNELPSKLLYNINAILPGDIAIINLLKVRDDLHCRFDAISREYKYFVYKKRILSWLIEHFTSLTHLILNPCKRRRLFYASTLILLLFLKGIHRSNHLYVR